ncbi:MAG: tRNA (adenosine(37)-N6)-threonylcarbamoyltransferase complex dimerization subunit type 1 TsaB [Hyphomicrobium sp.]
MNILAFDTCLAACSVAVGRDIGGAAPLVVARFEPMATGQAERLLPMIGEALREAGLALAEIDRIAVTNGPGTFTGTRIAVSAARALALPRGLEIVVFSSLETMALHGAIGEVPPGTDLAVAMNAHRGEVYVQLFDGRTRSAATAPALIGVERAAAHWSGREVLAVGSGAHLIAEADTAGGSRITTALPDLLPSAEHVLKAATGKTPLAEPLRPLYLRAADAKPQAGKSLERAT